MVPEVLFRFLHCNRDPNTRMWLASIPHKRLFDMAIAQASGSQPVGREPLGAAVVTRQVSCMLDICIAIQNVEKLQL